jgi:hypothetical protein
MYSLDDGKRKGVGSGMGLFLTECGPLAEDSAAKLKGGQLNLYLYSYSVLFYPPRLEFVPDWPAVSVSSWQQ